MRRDMSYRKPAPVYVPSPPTSPGVEPIRPAFLIDDGNDQIVQGQPHNPVIVVKEKPLPTIPKKAQTASDTKPLAAPRRTKVEALPVTRQSSKARTTSSGALSALNYCSDSENTLASCASKPIQQSPSQRSRQTHTPAPQYRPPTPPRQTENRRYSRGYNTTILQKDHDHKGASIYNHRDRTHSQETHYERHHHQFYGPRASRVVRAESLGTNRSCMTERTQFSASERSMAWSGGMTIVARTDSGYPSFPVLPTISRNEIRDRELLPQAELDGYEMIHSSFWDKMGAWIESLKIRSKGIFKGCCL